MPEMIVSHFHRLVERNPLKVLIPPIDSCPKLYHICSYYNIYFEGN